MSDTGLALEPEDRIADLERELRQRDDKIKELRTELAEAQELADQMREHTEDLNRLLDQWIDIYDMQQDPQTGAWVFDSSQSELWEKHAALWKAHQDMVRR